MSFMKIWDNASYKETGLPCTVPVLAVVCPSDPDSVYFALKQGIFGINVPAQTHAQRGLCAGEHSRAAAAGVHGLGATAN
jgi:hypothetical protein